MKRILAIFLMTSSIGAFVLPSTKNVSPDLVLSAAYELKYPNGPYYSAQGGLHCEELPSVEGENMSSSCTVDVGTDQKASVKESEKLIAELKSLDPGIPGSLWVFDGKYTAEVISYAANKLLYL